MKDAARAVRMQNQEDPVRMDVTDEVAWTPEPDTTSDTIDFTVYNGEEAVYSGSIAVTRIARPSEIANTYLAQLNCHGLAMSAKASNLGARRADRT